MLVLLLLLLGQQPVLPLELLLLLHSCLALLLLKVPRAQLLLHEHSLMVPQSLCLNCQGSVKAHVLLL